MEIIVFVLFSRTSAAASFCTFFSRFFFINYINNNSNCNWVIVTCYNCPPKNITIAPDRTFYTNNLIKIENKCFKNTIGNIKLINVCFLSFRPHLHTVKNKKVRLQIVKII